VTFGGGMTIENCGLALPSTAWKKLLFIQYWYHFRSAACGSKTLSKVPFAMDALLLYDFYTMFPDILGPYLPTPGLDGRKSEL